MSKRETQLEGYALCLVSIGYADYIVSTYISVPAIYTPDIQCDGGCYHDEGWFDYDFDNAVILYPDEYDFVGPCGRLREGKGKIDKLITVFEADLEEND